MNDLNAIVAAHGEAVWRTAYRLLNHRDDALDCYQETFLAAAKLFDQGQVRHWRTLLVQIATRRAMDRLRKRYEERQATANAAVDFVHPASDGSAARLIEGEELREQVRRVLARLPPAQAEAFWLRHLEQWTAAEVAQVLKIDPGHVRVLVHRASVALREQLRSTYGQSSAREGET
jgi:RNA polymerase sigma-70 factor (ECF subfamily)